MKAHCPVCKWKGEIGSPEIKSCPVCGQEIIYQEIEKPKEEEKTNEKKTKKVGKDRSPKISQKKKVA